jgi:hypothetical protein
MRHFDGVDVILCAETENTFEDLGVSEPFVLPVPVDSGVAPCGVCYDHTYNTDAETERYVLCWKVDDENYLQQGSKEMLSAKPDARVIPLTN